MRASAFVRWSSAAAVALAATVVDTPANSSLLEEPPKLVTFRLDDPAGVRIRLLDAFRDASVEPSSGWRHYFSGQWGRWRSKPWWTLSHRADEPEPIAISIALREPAPMDGRLLSNDEEPLFEPATSLPIETSTDLLGAIPRPPVVKTPFAIFANNGFDSIFSIPPSKPIPNWRCRRRPVRIARYGGESDVFPLVHCDGSVAPQAFDRLTLMAREATAPRPGELLPDEPDPAALARDEWTSGVRLVHPRLIWALQRIADAFPWRTVYVFSGYRHDPSGKPKPGTHHSMHAEARALDINVMGIPNAALFKVCHELEDVGCGFYPNNKFVHVDIRRPGSGHPFWIDVSAPGEPSRYVDAWPGVIESGGLVWDPAGKRGDLSSSSAEASCIRRGGT
jgi:hypothetical protein